MNTGSGSPTAGEPEYLVVGIIRHPHGLKGEMLMEVITDFPERLVPNSNVILEEGWRHVEVVVARPYKQGLLVKLKGIDSPEEAGRYRGNKIYVKSSNRPPLPEGYYYHHQLIGLQVVNGQGEVIGCLKEILQTGANDVYAVATGKGTELLLPAIDSVILEIDLNLRRMRVQVPAGIRDIPMNTT
jgi:16S rRNA processing protein RimM